MIILFFFFQKVSVDIKSLSFSFFFVAPSSTSLRDSSVILHEQIEWIDVSRVPFRCQEPFECPISSKYSYR